MDARIRVVANLDRAGEQLRAIFAAIGASEPSPSGPVQSLGSEAAAHGAVIALSTPIGALELAITADDDALRMCAELLFGAPAETSVAAVECQDALGELANMVMGRIKHDVIECSGREFSLGVPRQAMAARESAGRVSAIARWCRAFSWADRPGQLTLIWSERNSAVLLQEISAIMGHADQLEEIRTRQELLQLAEEMREAVPEEDSARVQLSDAVVDFLALALNEASMLQGSELERAGVAIESLLDAALQDLRARGIMAVDPMQARHAARAGGSYALDLDRQLGELLPQFAADVREQLAALDDLLAEMAGRGHSRTRWEGVSRILYRIAGNAGLLGLSELHDLAVASQCAVALLICEEEHPGPTVIEVFDRSVGFMLEIVEAVEAAIVGDGIVRENSGVGRHIDQMMDLVQASQNQLGAREAGPWLEAPSSSSPRFGAGHSSVLVRSGALDELASMQRELGELAASMPAGPALTTLQSLRRRFVALHNEFCLVRARSVLRRSARHCRDLLRQHDRIVRVHIEGEEIVLPGRMADELSDILCALVELSIVHSIEPHESREQAGKDLVATLNIRARLDRTGIAFEVEDDGRGLASFVEGEVRIDAVSARARNFAVLQRDCSQLGGGMRYLERSGGKHCFVIDLPMTVDACDQLPLEPTAATAELTMMVL